MPEETKKESEVPFNFEEGVSTIFSKDKESGESGLSPAEDARLNLKRELSDLKKQYKENEPLDFSGLNLMIEGMQI